MRQNSGLLGIVNNDSEWLHCRGIDIDRPHQALRLEMMALFADIGIACG